MPRTSQGKYVTQASKVFQEGDDNWHAGRYDEARSCYEKAAGLYNDSGDTEGEAFALSRLGELELSLENYEAASAALNASVELVKNFVDGQNTYGDALIKLSKVQAAAGNTDEAIATVRRAQEVLSAIGNRDLLGDAYDHEAYVYLMLNREDDASEAYRKAADLFKQDGNSLKEASTLRAIARIEMKNKNYDVAHDLLEKCRNLYRENGDLLGEASALCARMHFSLDRVVGLAATDKLSFQLKFKEFTALLETYNEILERDIAFMREVASDPTTEFAMATNSLPAEFYGKYDNLNRFKLFKWLYQHEVGNPAVRTFEELKLPAELQRNCREYVRWVQSVATTYLIFDDSNFKHWLNALRAYREMHLISQESVRVLRDELFAMLDEMETVAVKGEFENGNRIFLYLSDIDLESSYSYVTTSRHQAVNIGMFSLNGLRTPDPLMYEYVKKWIKTQSRFSTLISGSGELRRIHYFKRQREIVAQLG